MIPDDVIGSDAQWLYIDAFMNLIEAGERPAIVLRSRAHDALYLSARGILEAREVI